MINRVCDTGNFASLTTAAPSDITSVALAIPGDVFSPPTAAIAHDYPPCQNSNGSSPRTCDIPSRRGGFKSWEGHRRRGPHQGKRKSSFDASKELQNFSVVVVLICVTSLLCGLLLCVTSLLCGLLLCVTSLLCGLLRGVTSLLCGLLRGVTSLLCIEKRYK